jgi:UDP-2,3-diacylglucosamine hydrolase
MARTGDRVLFAGDVHLHPDRPDVAERFTRFLEEVVPGASALYVMGDLFEHWVSPRQADQAFYAEMLARLRRAAASTGGAWFLPGNRDFLFDPETAASAGMRSLPLWHDLRLGDDHVLLTHGDLLCARDRAYQRMRALLRMPFIRWIYRIMPLWAATRLGGMLRGLSRKAVAAKTRTVRTLAPEAVYRAFQSGHRDVLVCGHVHTPADVKVRVLGRDRRVLIIPQWEERGGWVEWSDGRWRGVDQGA